MILVNQELIGKYMTFLQITIALWLAIFLNLAIADTDTSTPLVETEWLASHLDNVVVLDVRTNNKSFISNPSYQSNKATGKKFLSRVGGHIPGARLILYKNVRGDRLIDGKSIKHMTISGKNFEALMQKAGVNQEHHIVITTNAESSFDLTMASRMYWQVKYFGHNKVSLLNGGTAQWLVDGREIVTTKKAKYEAGNWKAQQENNDLFADSDDAHVATNNQGIQLIDVHPLGQYLGTFKSGKAKSKGHIPTAKVFPVDLISSRNTPVKFSSASELTTLSQALGIEIDNPVITYCNSGHMASGGWFVFHEILGNKDVRLYDGSMHQWTHEDRPVISMKME